MQPTITRHENGSVTDAVPMPTHLFDGLKRSTA